MVVSFITRPKNKRVLTTSSLLKRCRHSKLSSMQLLHRTHGIIFVHVQLTTDTQMQYVRMYAGCSTLSVSQTYMHKSAQDKTAGFMFVHTHTKCSLWQGTINSWARLPLQIRTRTHFNPPPYSSFFCSLKCCFGDFFGALPSYLSTCLSASQWNG